MTEPIGKQPAEQIRAEYVETLRRWYASYEGCTVGGCQGCDTTVESAVDALAEAGLLPTGVRWSIAWRHVPERPLASGGQTTAMPPGPHIGTGEAAE